MSDKRVAIIANGSFQPGGPVQSCLEQADIIICADGGADHALKLGILPHVLLGDFDSISPQTRKILQDQGVELVSFSPVKDKTDTELAVEFAVKAGAREIFLLGATGSRLDHSLANLYLLFKAAHLGVKLSLVDRVNQVWLVEKEISLRGSRGQYLSLLPLSPQVTGVTTRGLKYPLKGATLVWGSSWGVSNEFLDSEAGVTLAKGQLLVIQIWEPPDQTK
ncbi:MAG: thiamine diphosphokinase [bacterium]